jgi:two-component system sensor histidine kinase/response regulator
VSGRPIVLVIDDSPVTVRAASLLLERAGYTTHAAITADDGLRQARTLVPRVILLDVELPDGDGYTVCRQLKADPATAHIPVILCTGRGEALDEADRFGVEAAAYLPKPFSPSALRDLVARFARSHS